VTVSNEWDNENY